MTQYLQKTFKVHSGIGQDYRDRWDAIFAKKEEEPAQVDTPDPLDDAVAGALAGSNGFVGELLAFCTEHGLDTSAEDRLFEIVRDGIDEESLQSQVFEFHQTYGCPVADSPSVPDKAVVMLRLRLVTEEFLEFLEAHNIPTGLAGAALETAIENSAIYDEIKVDLVDVADAMADLDYVVEGTRLTYGIDGVPVAKEVHRSNLSKLGEDGLPIRNEHGKVIKGPHYSPPDIAGCLRDQGWKE